MSEKEEVTAAAEANKAVPKLTEASSATGKVDSGCSESRLEHETRVRHYFDPLFSHCFAT